MFKSRFARIVLGIGVTSISLLAQEAGRSEVTVQLLGSFVKSTTQDGVRQDATNSGGVLGNYRFFFSKSHGVEVNYGYSRSTQSYGFASGPSGVKANQHEVSAAYVFRHAFKGLTAFAESGVGGLIFEPVDDYAIDSQTRAAFVYGGGADFNITHRIFVRAQYRGFVYSSPTFDLAPAANADRVTHRAEPSIGFGYRF